MASRIEHVFDFDEDGNSIKKYVDKATGNVIKTEIVQEEEVEAAKKLEKPASKKKSKPRLDVEIPDNPPPPSTPPTVVPKTHLISAREMSERAERIREEQVQSRIEEICSSALNQSQSEILKGRYTFTLDTKKEEPSVIKGIFTTLRKLNYTIKKEEQKDCIVVTIKWPTTTRKSKKNKVVKKETVSKSSKPNIKKPKHIEDDEDSVLTFTPTKPRK